uniref:Vesicle-associated membrane protein 3 n=1 Tax=Phallusia mammillata TaxID=59560 RepID=A0A6F9DX54_9ASCI|nr:vesicle-associated membrane protein 3 [Phallusia mammillata]
MIIMLSVVILIIVIIVISKYIFWKFLCRMLGVYLSKSACMLTRFLVVCNWSLFFQMWAILIIIILVIIIIIVGEYVQHSNICSPKGKPGPHLSFNRPYLLFTCKLFSSVVACCLKL